MQKFDTLVVEPGGTHRFFSNTNIGDLDKCNIYQAETLAMDHTFVMFSMGIRALDHSKDAEKIILGYLNVTLTMGDRPYFESQGACLSTLLDQQPRGYVFHAPVIVPVRQNCYIEIKGDEEMMEPVRLRVSLFGVESRDVS